MSSNFLTWLHSQKQSNVGSTFELGITHSQLTTKSLGIADHKIPELKKMELM